MDQALAHRQWNHLVDVLRELGDRIDVIDAAAGCPDMTFSGDAGLVYGRTFVPSNFRNPERQGEVDHYRRWFAERGYDVVPMEPGVFFEGLGDMVFEGTRAIMGHGIRSDPRSVEVVRRLTPDLEILCDLRIVDDRYFHLAMALGFIDPDTVVYYPPALEDDSVRRLCDAVEHPIAVSDIDANVYFACNNLVVGRTVLLDGCTDEMERALGERGYGVRRCPMSEFKKSGGSLRCLVLSFLGDGGAPEAGV